MTNGYPFSLSNEEFKDKRILVTGGTKGVGEAIVRALCRRACPGGRTPVKASCSCSLSNTASNGLDPARSDSGVPVSWFVS
jgi:hypothetical protein